jgi:hypothetical protein
MTDHPAHDADEALRPLVAGCLAAIVVVLLIAAMIVWMASPVRDGTGVDELAPTATTTP